MTMVKDSQWHGVYVIERTNMCLNFLKKLKDHAGPVNPTYFMSDDAEQFFSAWIVPQ